MTLKKKLNEITWRFYGCCEKLFTVDGGIKILSKIPAKTKKELKTNDRIFN